MTPLAAAGHALALCIPWLVAVAFIARDLETYAPRPSRIRRILEGK